MRKFFGFGSQKGNLSSTSQQRDGADTVIEYSSRISSEPKYHIRDKDLGKIHKAASIGKVRKVQKILLLQENGLNDRDKKNRTALHLACANGHPNVVTLLADRKCSLNLCDNENKTALIKAIQCREERCATILLERGADPNIMDIDGNTALHYAVAAQNMDMAAKLLSYNADIEASNKDELTPLLLAVNEKKQQMVEFLVKRNANVHAVDKMKRTSLMLAVNDSTSDIVRLLLQQGVDVFAQDNWGWTAEEHAFKRGHNFNYKLIHDYKVGEICKQFSQNKNQASEHSEGASVHSCLVKPDTDDSWPESDDEDLCFEKKNVVNPSVAKIMSVVQQALKNIDEKYDTSRNAKETSFEDNQAHCENEDGSATLPKPSAAVQDEETKPAIGNEENGINVIESAPQEQTNNDNLICADGTRENDTNALGLGKKEDEESPWDSESFSASVAGNYIVYLPEAAEESGKNIPNGQAKISSDWDSTSLPSNHKTRQRTEDLKVEDKCPFVSQSMMLNQSGSTDFGHMTLAHKETTNIGAVFLIESPRPHDQRESQLSEKGERKEDFSAELGLGLTSDEKQERLHGSEKNHPRIIEEQNDSQRQLSQEPNARISQGTILTNHLCKQKKIEINLKEMNSEVSESHEKEEGLLHENHMLRDEIAMLRLEIDAVKNQKQEMEKKNLEDIATVEDKNDHYQKTIKLNEETFTKKIFEYTAQLNILTAENMMLKSQLENEKENKERLETEVESYCSRLATATYEYEQGQTSKKDLELSFQKARDEWHCLRDKMNFDLSNLKGNNEMLSQQLCKAESKLNSLETELHQTRVTLREKTLVLECVQTDLSQTQCQKKEIEYKYQHEQDKVNECTEKQKSLEERLSQLQREKALLQQQLDDALHKVAGQEEALINMQEQFQDAIKRLKAESEKQGRLLQEKNQKLINECSHLKERMCRYELDKEEREVSESHEKEEGLLHENHMLRDEIAMLRLEIDTVKNQKEEMEKKHLEDIATVKDKNDGLQNTMRPNEETLTRKIFQYTAQLNILTAENTMLKSQLEDEKQKKERLETEIKSYRSKLATAAHDHEQGQTSEENLKLSFQREGDEWHCLRDKMNFDLSNLKGNNEMLSQQLCKAESKLNSLETELHQTRVALRERTLVLECVQTDLSQTQCQKKEIEYKYQHEQDKVNECTEKQKSLEERLSQLQREKALLQQQLDDALHKVAGQEEALINMQEQFQDAIKRLKAESEKQGRLLQEKNQKLINECSHLKERMCRYELDKEEREVSESHEKEEGLLHENHMLRDEIAMLRLEIDTVKNQKEEMEKKHLEDIATVKDKNDGLQNTMRPNEETLTRKIFQYTAQLNILTAENTMLKSQLKDEKQNKERLETEIKSYRSKLATAAHDHEQGQTSEENLKLSFQREGDEWHCLRDKMNFDLSNLKGNNEMLSQQLCKAESKLNSLETELHQTRVALREKTLVLECVQTDLSQTQCQKKEIEYKYQHEQDKVSECTEKQKSLEERLSQLQSENALLQQQLNDAHLKVAGQEKALINMREQFQDAKKRLKAEREKLQEKNQKLINECSHLKERMRRYELDKEEREVSESHEKEEGLLHENHMLRDEIAMLRLEIDTVKNQKEEMEKKHLEDIATVKDKNDGLQNTMRPNEETLTRKIFQYTAQLNILTAENTMLKSQLKDEKQNKERLETEIKSYRSKLATAAHDHEQGQTSEENLKLSFQREGDEWHCLRDKMNFDLSNLKGNNEMLSQQLCKAESKLNSLETELHQTRVALREKTLVLECVQTDLSQTQCQKKEIEYKYQHEQDKVSECTEKQKSLEERLSQLQSENALLQQQLNDAHLKVAGQEKALINMREQFQDAKKRLKAEREKLQEKNQKLINECSHLKERMRRYELDKEEREVSESHEKEEGLLHENHMLRDEIAMLRLEIDTVKNQKQEMEKKHLEDIATVKDKNDRLRNTIRLNEKTLTRIIFQYTAQLNILTAENTMLKSQLKDEKQNKERLETEIKSYRSKLATAAHDHEQGQTSEENLKLSFQREGDEWLCFRVKMNFDLSNLKGNNEMLSQQLCKAESKLNSLETELHQTRVALREKTLVLECVQTDLSQTQCQKKEIEYKYQHEQDKVSECTEKQKSLEERLSQLQSENALLQQQLNDAHLKVAGQEKALINMREQFQDAKKRLKAEREKLQEKNQKLINECSHLKERMRRYELDKEEREVVVRQLQQELADTLSKQSISEVSLEVTARYHTNLGDETHDVKTKLDPIRSQVQEASDEHVKAIKCAEKMQDQTQKLEIECAELKDTIKKQASRIEQLQRHLLSTSLSENEKELLKQSLEYRLDEEKRKNGELEKEITRLKELLKITGRKLNEYEKGELHFSGDLRPSHTEMDVPITKLKQKITDTMAKLETVSSKCLRLGKENQFLRQQLLSLKGIQTKCDELKNENKNLKGKLVILQNHIEMNMVEYSEVKQYKHEIEERARQEIAKKLKEVDLFLQSRAASQENLPHLGENYSSSIESDTELRTEDLESELSKVKSSQVDSNKTDLEKYKELYLKELQVRASLTWRLNKAYERLAETRTKLRVMEQQNKSLLSTLNTRPVWRPPRPATQSFMFNRNPTRRENLVIPTSIPWTSNNSMETYLFKTQQELEKNILRELKEAEDELESESCRLSSLL